MVRHSATRYSVQPSLGPQDQQGALRHRAARVEPPVGRESSRSPDPRSVTFAEASDPDHARTRYTRGQRRFCRLAYRTDDPHAQIRCADHRRSVQAHAWSILRLLLPSTSPYLPARWAVRVASAWSWSRSPAGFGSPHDVLPWPAAGIGESNTHALTTASATTKHCFLILNLPLCPAFRVYVDTRWGCPSSC